MKVKSLIFPLGLCPGPRRQRKTPTLRHGLPVLSPLKTRLSPAAWLLLGAVVTTSLLTSPLPVAAQVDAGSGLEADQPQSPGSPPLFPAGYAVDVSGSRLQMSSTLWPPLWVNTNSPWSATNPTGAAFFRSRDPAGPTITCRVVYSSQGTFYVATNGSRTNSGLSASAPWPLAYALTNADAGSTLIVLPGTYPGDCEIDKPLTVRSQVKWGARLVNLPYGLNIGYAGNAAGTVLDGFEVANSSVHGIIIRSSNCVVRHCWVHDAGIYRRPLGRTQANSGITSKANGTTVEFCLAENNGSTPGYDHGIYVAGTNVTIRGNVARGNWGFGLHLYDESVGVSGQVYNNLVYSNAFKTVNNWDGVYQEPRGTNTLAMWNNTLLAAQGPPLQGALGRLCLSNNIILGPGKSMFGIYSQTILADYNLSSVPLSPYAGAHDVVSSQANFVSPSTGLYWLLASSPARGCANRSILPPMDFWGTPQTAIIDMGAFQYSASYAADTRTLDPSTASGADYWDTLGAAPVKTVLPSLWETP